MTSVRYIPAISTDAGAVPVSTEVATHPRAGDGFEVQDVYAEQLIDGTQKTRITDGANTAAVVAGDVTGVKGLRVYGGPTDPVSDIPVTIDFEHHQVHEGESFKVVELQSLGTGTVKYSIDVGVFTPSIRSPHMLIAVDVYNGAARLVLYEGATYTGGATKTNYNRNRNSATTATAVIKTGVTSTNGTMIDTFFSAGGNKSGGNSRAQAEWLLKNSTTYRVDLVGLTAGTQAIISFEWYEDLGV